MLDPTRILATIERATARFRSTPGRAGSVITLAPEAVADILVVGDLHGHVDIFTYVLKRAALEANPKRHLVLQELAHDTRIDPDEGQIDRSHRLIDLVCALKCQIPARVHYLLGNHELSELTDRSISKGGYALNTLFAQGIEADYGSRAPEFSAAYHTLFAALPVAIRLPNRVLLCHTIPDGRDLDRLDLEALAGDAWPEESLKRGGTVYALTWGRDTRPETADRFAALVGADLFITGHQPCDAGFLQANHRQIILDGTDPAPAYCLFDAGTATTIEGLLAACHHVPLG
jgi:hypothetical protein